MPGVLLSTAYFPPISYFSYLSKADIAFIEQYETYPKQTYRNRCEIYSPNGRLSLSIPVSKTKGQHSQTRDILLSTHLPWQRNHQRTLETAYNSSAFFLYYKDELFALYKKTHKTLIDFNLSILEYLLQTLGLKTKIQLTKAFEKTPTGLMDLRYRISPKEPYPDRGVSAYFQVFSDKFGFIPNLSILDLLFNEGPDAGGYIKSL